MSAVVHDGINSVERIMSGTLGVLMMARSFSKGLASISAAVLAFSSVGVAQAAQLVTNGGFETGSFSGWTLGGRKAGTKVAPVSKITKDTPVLDNGDTLGNDSALLGAIGKPGTLTQYLPTLIGQMYDISFELANLSHYNGTFAATFGSDTILNAIIPTSTMKIGKTTYLDFTKYSAEFIATSASTPLTFTYQEKSNHFVLDDVSVVSVPEPATWALMLMGLGMAGYALRRNRRQALAYI